MKHTYFLSFSIQSKLDNFPSSLIDFCPLTQNLNTAFWIGTFYLGHIPERKLDLPEAGHILNSLFGPTQYISLFKISLSSAHSLYSVYITRLVFAVCIPSHHEKKKHTRQTFLMTGPFKLEFFLMWSFAI